MVYPVKNNAPLEFLTVFTGIKPYTTGHLFPFFQKAKLLQIYEIEHRGKDYRFIKK